VSLDYPYYEELCRRKHRAAWWWLVGDWLYYLGLLPGMLALPTAGILFVSWLLGVGEHYLAMAGLAAATFPVAVLVFLVGSSVKRHAYTLGERDGITAAEVYRHGSASQDSGTVLGTGVSDDKQ
jgi:hypothetical protein